MAKAEPVAGSGFRLFFASYFRSTLAPAFSSFALLFGIGLVHAFLHRLRRAFDQVLGFLEAQAGDRAHFLDDFDLLVAGGREWTVNSVFSSAAAAGAAAAAATATGAAAETPHFSSSIFESSAASMTVSSERSSTILLRFAMILVPDIGIFMNAEMTVKRRPWSRKR